METFISDEEIVDLLVNLVRIPSVNPPADTRECAEFIVRTFESEKIEARSVCGNDRQCKAVAGLRGRNNGKTLLLNGHIDVVAPGEDWTVDPFGGEIRDDMIYGRGTCDMKSGVAAMMAAMIGLKRSNAEFNGEIIFQAVADEETGSQWGTVHLLNSGIGRGADCAIVSEPTSLDVATGNRGLRWIDVAVKGSACHAGRPYLGVNSVHYAADLIRAIAGMTFEASHDFFEVPAPSISVTQIQGGTKANIIPERCEFAIDRRMMPGETGNSVMQELQQIVDALELSQKGLQVEMTTRPGFWDPFVTPGDEPVVQAVVSAVEAVTGSRPEILGKAGCTDASHIFHMAGVPTVIFGPGNEKLAHKPDECVGIAQLVASVRVFMAIFRTLLG